MISLLEIAQNIYEADEDKYVHIGYGKYKEKGKEDDEDAEVYKKTDSGKFVKSSDQSDDGKDKDKEPDEPKGTKLGKGDFDRDSNKAGDDDADDMDRDADDEVEQAIASAEKLADKYGIESDIAGNEQGLNRVNIGAGGEYEGDNSITVNYDDGKYGVGIQGEDAMQGPISYMSFDSKEEMESALDKVLGDKKVRSALKKGDSLEGMKDDIESLMKGGSDAGAKDGGFSDDTNLWDPNGPEDRDQIMKALLKDPEISAKLGDKPYWDDVSVVGDDDETAVKLKPNMTLGDMKKQILGKQGAAIKWRQPAPQQKLPDIMTKNIGKGRKRKENPESWDDVKEGDQYLHANGEVIHVVQRSASGNRIQVIIHPNPEHTSPSGGKRKKRTAVLAKPGKSQWKPGFNPSGASIAQLNKNRIIPIPLDAIKGSTEHDPEYKKESKESNPRIFKEIYDRTFRSLK